YSNKLLAAMGGPSERFYLAGLRYTNNENDGVVGKQPNQFHLGPSKAYRADNHVPVLIFPNPINPDKYLVLNSGFTFREYDYLNNARQSPKLPDWAVIDVTVPPNTRSPGGVVEAGFFSEEWSPYPADPESDLPVAASGDFTVYRWRDVVVGNNFGGYRLSLNDSTYMASSIHDSNLPAIVNRRTGTTYYHRFGPVGLAIAKLGGFRSDAPTAGAHAADVRLAASLAGLGACSMGTPLPASQLVGTWSEPAVAVIGINAGTPAAYARPFQFMDFYDLDGSAVPLSFPPNGQKPYFLYLGDAKQRGANVRFNLGPVRQLLRAKAPRHFYDLLFIDTIRQDVSKPAMDLLTKEAFASYLDLMTERGVICIHTSNRHWNLVPVVADIAQDLGLACKVLNDAGGGQED